MYYEEKQITRNTILLPILGIITFTIIATYTCLSDYQERNLRDLHHKEEEFLEDKKELIKQAAKSIVDYVNYYRETTKFRLKDDIQSRAYEAETIIMRVYTDNIGKESIKEIKHEALEAIGKINFNDGRGYYTVIDKKTKMTLVDPMTQGRDSSNVFLEGNKNRYDTIIKALEKDDEGFLEINLKKPFEGDVKRKKIIFVRYVELFDWMIVVGEFLEDIEYEVQDEVIERIKNFRFGDGNYFFIYDYDGNNIMHPIDSMRNVNMYNFKTVDGVMLGQEFIKQAKRKDGGFINYKWIEEGETKPIDKLGFSMGIDQWKWVIGTGVSIEDVKEKIAKTRVEQKKEIDNQREKFIFLGFLAIVISIAFSLYLSSAIKTIFSRYREQVREKNRKLRELNTGLEDRVQDELEKNRKKDELIIKQSKLAIMGEMLTMIAHQWRQPINVVGLIIQELQDAYEYKEIDKNYINKTVKNTMEQLNYLSKTISDFSNFFRPNKQLEVVTINKVLEKTLNLAKGSLNQSKTEVEIKCNCEKQIYIHTSELIQILLNIINNATDEFLSRKIENPKIVIESTSDEDYKIIIISDNAGGIPEDIIHKIFEPYFSTKDKNGTGLGLYMAKIVVESHMNGELYAENRDGGATFFIKIPIKKKDTK